jgi:hypothetical protein
MCAMNTCCILAQNRMKTKASDTVQEYLTGGGVPYLFIAIPMIGMGSYLFYLGISELIHSKETIPALIFMLIGPVFLTVGILLTLFREGVTLDRLQGTASQWRKLFQRKTYAVHKLNEFRSIHLYIHRSPKRTSHIVELIGESKKILLCNFLNLEAAKNSANEVSQFSSLPVIDKTSEE